MKSALSRARGFVTIATGERHYYEIARNLLRSYRLFSKHPMPFAIICDQDNEITSEFDDVVLIDNPYKSFLDKLRLPELAPYDETIFIDSDCLAYRDLNGLWKFFSHCGDFSTLGKSFPFGTHGWFQREDAGVFKDKVKFSMICQGGVYFMRKGRLDTFSDTCRYILDNYESFRFPAYPVTDPVDEPVFALACAVHGYAPACNYKRVFCYFPICDCIEADISRGWLSYRYPPKKRDSLGRYLLHWSTVETKGEMYADEVCKLERMVSSGFKPPVRWEFRNRLTDCFRLSISRFCRLISYLFPSGLKERVFACLNWKRLNK